MEKENLQNLIKVYRDELRRTQENASALSLIIGLLEKHLDSYD